MAFGIEEWGTGRWAVVDEKGVAAKVNGVRQFGLARERAELLAALLNQIEISKPEHLH